MAANDNQRQRGMTVPPVCRHDEGAAAPAEGVPLRGLHALKPNGRRWCEWAQCGTMVELI
jgi:hypothetical protein